MLVEPAQLTPCRAGRGSASFTREVSSVTDQNAVKVAEQRTETISFAREFDESKHKC